MKNILILGGGGVFANHIAKHFLDLDYNKVVAVGRNPRLPECHTLGVGSGDSRYEYHQIHIVFEQKRLFKLIEKLKPNLILNYAALAYANSWNDSALFYNTNLVSVVEIAEFLKHSDYLENFIQIGSSEMYGPSIDKPAKEDDIPNPTSPYAVSKLALDMHLNTLWSVEGFPMNIVRPSNCYATGQYAYRIIPKAILFLLSGKKFPLEGGGIAEKSFMYVDDLNSAIQLIIDNKILGETFNVGPKDALSMRAITEEICVQLNLPFQDHVEITPGRIGEDRKYWIDSGKIERTLGWKPNVSFEEGISRMIKWISDYRQDLLKSSDTFTLRA